MKLSNTLFKQNLGWHFKRLWNMQGKRKIINCETEKILKQNNINICDAKDIIKKEVKNFERVTVVGYKGENIEDTSQYETVLSYKDNHVLLEGLRQAKVLTNTVEIQEGIPEHLSKKEVSKTLSHRIEKLLLEALILDAEQKKLPKVKDPARPMFNFPRNYGVTREKVSKNFISKILHHVDMDCKSSLEKKYILQDLSFRLPLQKYGRTIQLDLKAESGIFSQKPLPPITKDTANNIELPNMFPLKPIVSLDVEKVIDTKTLYPFKSSRLRLYPHTVFVFYNPEEVKNIFEKEVTPDQIYARSLLKAWTVAGAFARQEHGENVGHLTNPVTVQCIQSDGKFFHFGVLQLNNLSTDDSTTERNIWYQTPLMTLYEDCSYTLGQPVLKGYNPNVVKLLYNFCNN